MKNLFKTLCLLGAVATLSTMTSHAATISVDWGGDYVTANQGFSQGSFGVYRFNDDNAADPTVPAGSNMRQRILFGLTNSTTGYYTPGSGYTAPSGKTGNFYLGENTLYANQFQDPSVFRVTDHAGADGIRLRTQDQTTTSYALLGFAKADFLNGTSSQTLSLDSTTSISITLGSDVGQSGTSAARYAVLNAGQWYLSNTTFSIAAGLNTLSSSGTETWGTIDPLGTDGVSALAGTGLNVAPGSFSSQTFNDVQGFGLWIGHTGNSTDQPLDFEVTGFSATTVPEPATWAMLLGGLGALALLRRRRANA